MTSKGLLSEKGDMIITLKSNSFATRNDKNSMQSHLDYIIKSENVNAILRKNNNERSR